MAAALEVFVPAAVLGAVDPNRTAVETPSSSLDAALAATLKYGGYNAYVRNPDKSLQFRIYDYTGGIKDLNKQKYELLKTAGDMDIEDLTRELHDISSKERELYNDLYEASDGYLAFDGKTHTNLSLKREPSKQESYSWRAAQ